jgi:RNA-directed DNA polymerase
LRTGSIYLNKFEETPDGTPQALGLGEIISPTLANFTLNGLEKAILEGIKKHYRVNKRGIYISTLNKNGKVIGSHISLKTSCIRYLDDFLVIANSRRMIDIAIKPSIIEFLNTRGLRLSPDKTKIISIRASEKVNFLSYTFQYQSSFKPKYKLFHDRIGKNGIACYPQKEKLNYISLKLKNIIRRSYNITYNELITIINPIIRR